MEECSTWEAWYVTYHASHLPDASRHRLLQMVEMTRLWARNCHTAWWRLCDCSICEAFMDLGEYQ